jgi:TRAP-type C4-dicarboxylate transport system permease small subunit
MAEAGTKALLAAVDRWADRMLYYLSAGLMLVVSALIIYTVIARYVFNSSPLWAEEAPRVIFIWLSYLGVAVATRRGQNLRVTYFLEMMRPKLRLALEMFMHAMVMVMLVVLLWNVWPIIRLTSNMIMLSTGWPSSVSYIPLPIACALMTVYQVRLAMRSIVEYRDGTWEKVRSAGVQGAV